MLQGIIFDMDGTLISTEEFHKLSAMAALQHFYPNITIDKDRAKKATTRSAGTTNRRSMEIILEEFELKLSVEELMKQKSTELMKLYQSTSDFCLIDGVRELIITLHEEEYPLAVASSSPYEEIVYITERFQIRQYFDLLFSGDFVKNSKPAPDIFLETANKIHLPPQNVLVFEDSANGVKAAKAAGMFTVGYNNPQTPHYDLGNADLQINSYYEVTPEILREKMKLG